MFRKTLLQASWNSSRLVQSVDNTRWRTSTFPETVIHTFRILLVDPAIISWNTVLQFKLYKKNITIEKCMGPGGLEIPMTCFYTQKYFLTKIWISIVVLDKCNQNCEYLWIYLLDSDTIEMLLGVLLLLIRFRYSKNIFT